MAGLDRRQINVKGVRELFLRELDPTPSDIFLSVGHLKSLKFSDGYNMVESINGAGELVDWKEAGQKVVATAELMQTDKAQIDFQRLAAAKYFEGFFAVLLNNGDTQEFSLTLCRLKPGQDLDFKPGERLIMMEFHMLAVFSALTRTPADYNVVVGKPYVMIQNTVPKGLPTDTATAVAALI